MGRPERPLDGLTQTGSLAQRLRSLRERAGLSYRQLAESTKYNASTYSRAASGSALPTLEVVELYALRCGADTPELRELRSLWRAAHRAREARPRTVPLDLIRQPAELCDAMVALRSRVGRPSLRTLEQRAGGFGRLPHSSLSLVLRRRAMPGRALLEHFVRACGVPSAELDRWLKAWDRISASRISRPAATDLLLQYRDLLTAEQQPDGSVRLSLPMTVNALVGTTGQSGWGLRGGPVSTVFTPQSGWLDEPAAP
ncbi:helix-turn-helix domain-containing protein [Kitasatospora viridis]|uniref:Helix-turn-helix protein n=1 Tax=Kitasatospora viridis TaxID=281105 RepID=A0A561UD57_9ACTN|nr:helix-turn-helix transcriptional regulator [Kitasatospora viridis]TWF97291.1 helix-turn-helix protein [Kitasatospora viridis]